MRGFSGKFAALGVVLLVAGAAGQGLAPKPPAFQHITVAASSSQPAAVKGGTVTLWVDVTPRPGVHIYAANPHGLTPVRLVLTPNAAFKPGKTVFPPSELAATVGISEPVAVHRKTFRIAQPIAISQSAVLGDTLRIAGAVNYQACDDRLCYPAASVPVSWVIPIK